MLLYFKYVNNYSSSPVVSGFNYYNRELTDFLNKSPFHNDIFRKSVQNATKINKLGDDNLVYNGSQTKQYTSELGKFLQTSVFNNPSEKSIKNEPTIPQSKERDYDNINADLHTEASGFFNVPEESIKNEPYRANLNYPELYSKFFTQYKNGCAKINNKFHQGEERLNAPKRNDVKML